MLLMLLTGIALAAEGDIRQCLDAQGRLVYQDQPCMGQLRRADIDAPMTQPAWRSAKRGCRLRSPLLQVVTPPPDPADSIDDGAAEPAGRPSTFSRQPIVPPASSSTTDDDANPLTLGLWLELAGTSDGVALSIRGFQPLPQTAISFDTNISGQGIRVDDGQMVEVDSLDGPGSLRYGYRKSSILLKHLQGPVATLDVRIPGWQAQPVRLDALELKDAVARLKDCVRERDMLPGQRRRPGA